MYDHVDAALHEQSSVAQLGSTLVRTFLISVLPLVPLLYSWYRLGLLWNGPYAWYKTALLVNGNSNTTNVPQGPRNSFQIPIRTKDATFEQYLPRSDNEDSENEKTSDARSARRRSKSSHKLDGSNALAKGARGAPGALQVSVKSQPIYRCLRCRQSGHHITECQFAAGVDDEDWSTATSAVSDGSHTDVQDSELCSRCQWLNLTEMFMQPNDIKFRKGGNHGRHALREQYEFTNYSHTENIEAGNTSFSNDDKKYFKHLGYASYVHFERSCPMCTLLFALAPRCNDVNTELLIIPDWILHRLEPTLEVPSPSASYATCLYISDVGKTRYLKDYDRRTQLTHCSDARNVLCILDTGTTANSPTVACGRKVERVADYRLITSWLKHCEELHSTCCRMEWSMHLRSIRLIDVKARRLVQYPTNRNIEYLALSYVWGKVTKKNFSVGALVKGVPTTIEDAMEVTRQLGKRYLWVDSICIDQVNVTHKAEQIKLMSAIYRAAYATIVALSGRCAYSGLPRVSSNHIRRSAELTFPQLSRNIQGMCLGMTMPTLRQQIQRSNWATRAWTYQEALLSPRCIYFTQHQVYFECNVSQCCESIDGSTSATHSMTREKLSPMIYPQPASVLGKGIFRNPFFGYSDYSISQEILKVQEASRKATAYHKLGKVPARDFRGLLGYHQLISRYCNRKMTNQSDALEAVSGLLHQLQEEYYYEQGFYCGVPCSDMPLALLWTFDTSRRRPEFPSWCWAGHDGPMLEAYPKDVSPASWLPTGLTICKAEGSTLTVLHDVAQVWGDDDYGGRNGTWGIKDDEISSQWSFISFLLEYRAKEVQAAGVLFIKGIVLQMAFSEILDTPPSNGYKEQPLAPITPAITFPEWDKYGWRRTAVSYSVENGILYDNRWVESEPRKEINKHCNQMRDFLLVAREQRDKYSIRHYLLLLEDHYIGMTKIKSRAGFVCLDLKLPKHKFRLFNPTHRWVALA